VAISLIVTQFNYLHIITTNFLKNDINRNITLCCQAVSILNVFHVFPVYGTCPIPSTILRLRKKVMNLFRPIRLVMSVHLPICPHAKALLPPDRFSLNLIWILLWKSVKKIHKNPYLVKIGQKYQVLYMKIYICFVVLRGTHFARQCRE